MRRRVLLGELEHETSTFNPSPTRLDMFRVREGEALLAEYGGTRTQLGGALQVLGSADIEVVPTYAANSVPGGLVSACDLGRLLDGLIGSIERALHIDGSSAVAGVLLSLHGAMAGVGEPDPEGELLARVRSLIGPSVPLVVSLDMHAVLTPRMAEHADILVPFHTYPHVDQYQTGVRAARCLLRMLDEPDLAPQIVWRRLPMLVRGDELITGRVPSSKSSSSSSECEGGQGSWQYTAAVGAFGGAIEMCQAIEEDGQGGIAAGVLIGNAFTDVPGLGSSVVVVRAGGAAQRVRADRACQRLGAYMWAHRRAFQASLTPLADAISLAEAALPTTRGRTGGTVTVLSDAADATSSGASGDSNAVIGAVLRHRFSGRALVPIVDAAAVLAAQRAGVGAELRLRLGGTLDPQRFSPLPLTATVLALHHDTSFTYENGTSGSAGHVALLRCCATAAGVPAGGTAGELHVLACTIPAYFVGQCVFVALGTPPAEYDLIVVKSPNGFRPHYASIAQQIIPVDGPGSTSANLQRLPYMHVQRPIFPLEPDTPPPPWLMPAAANL